MGSAVWAPFGITVVSLFEPAGAPRLFQSSHVEHLGAFYVVTILAMAALPQIRVILIASGLVLLAFFLAFVRIYLLSYQQDGPEDFICDLAGVLSALGPVFLGHPRDYVSHRE